MIGDLVKVIININHHKFVTSLQKIPGSGQFKTPSTVLPAMELGTWVFYFPSITTLFTGMLGPQRQQRPRVKYSPM